MYEHVLDRWLRFLIILYCLAKLAGTDSDHYINAKS